MYIIQNKYRVSYPDNSMSRYKTSKLMVPVLGKVSNILDGV